MQTTWQQSVGVEESHLVDFVDTSGKIHKINQMIVEDLSRLLEKAESDGVKISIVSAYRSFDQQIKIWNEKWQGVRPVLSRQGKILNISQMSHIDRYKAISLWSALPGLSRHHWGTDLDIFDAKAISNGYQVELLPQEFSQSGPCAKLNSWLEKHLVNLGFFRPYRQFQQGVSIEPWHISHINQSKNILNNFNFSACKKYIIHSEIKANQFIQEQFEHYTKQYFHNICEV